jgi:hypothetical protein
MQRTLNSSEFMPMLETVRADLVDSTVGFVNFHPAHEPTEIVLAGSGTLVSAGGFRAILTAAHVISNLPDSGPVGLILPTRFGPHRHQTKIEMQTVRKIIIARGTDEDKGPDIGLLILPSADLARFSDRKIFSNLSKRRKKMLHDPHPAIRGAWVLCGMVGEWTTNLPKERGYEHGKGFNGLCSPVALVNERQETDFDYFSIQAANNESYEGPESFGGCSGGGLWHLIIREREDKTLFIDEMLLAGVAFYQSGWIDGRNTIECHGRKSIYGTVVETLEKLKAN